LGPESEVRLLQSDLLRMSCIQFESLLTHSSFFGLFGLWEQILIEEHLDMFIGEQHLNHFGLVLLPESCIGGFSASFLDLLLDCIETVEEDVFNHRSESILVVPTLLKPSHFGLRSLQFILELCDSRCVLSGWLRDDVNLGLVTLTNGAGRFYLSLLFLRG